MKSLVKWILAANLTALAVLSFVYPNLMVGPGKLIPGHVELETDCFACHAPLRGVESARCISCHKVADIGRRTTRGEPLAKPLTRVPFHQKLQRDDCIACHSDHSGVRRYRVSERFVHSLLAGDYREVCRDCHRAPDDRLHRQISGNCSGCHNDTAWTPADFDHDRYFVLDRDHDARCDICHTGSDYSRYTCYGCHEHTPENVRREHIEEGIRDFRDCVECHKSADEHDIRMPGGRGRSRDRDDD